MGAAAMHEALSRALAEEDLGRLPPELVQSRGWTIFSRAYPLLAVGFLSADGTRLRVHLVHDDWNDRPPSAQFLDWEGRPLSAIERDPTGVFNNSAHPTTGRPFACMKGIREYHTHPSHLSDSWAAIKNDPRYSLTGILTQLWHAWKDIHP
jgi:hypothetical protein